MESVPDIYTRMPPLTLLQANHSAKTGRRSSARLTSATIATCWIPATPSVGRTFMNRASTQLSCATNSIIDGCKRTVWHSRPRLCRKSSACIRAQLRSSRGNSINEAKPATLGGLCFPTQMLLFPGFATFSRRAAQILDNTALLLMYCTSSSQQRNHFSCENVLISLIMGIYRRCDHNGTDGSVHLNFARVST